MHAHTLPPLALAKDSTKKREREREREKGRSLLGIDAGKRLIQCHPRQRCNTDTNYAQLMFKNLLCTWRVSLTFPAGSDLRAMAHTGGVESAGPGKCFEGAPLRFQQLLNETPWPAKTSTSGAKCQEMRQRCQIQCSLCSARIFSLAGHAGHRL